MEIGRHCLGGRKKKDTILALKDVIIFNGFTLVPFSLWCNFLHCALVIFLSSKFYFVVSADWKKYLRFTIAEKVFRDLKFLHKKCVKELRQSLFSFKSVNYHLIFYYFLNENKFLSLYLAWALFYSDSSKVVEKFWNFFSNWGNVLVINDVIIHRDFKMFRVEKDYCSQK